MEEEGISEAITAIEENQEIPTWLIRQFQPVGHLQRLRDEFGRDYGQLSISAFKACVRNIDQTIELMRKTIPKYHIVKDQLESMGIWDTGIHESILAELCVTVSSSTY